jgi:hypothetical protein
VLLVFSEAATGLWRTTGEVSEPGNLERHGLSSAFAIPGIGPDAAALPDAPTGTEVVLVVPPGGKLRVSEAGAGGDAEQVVLAGKLATELAKIQTAIGALGGSYTPGGADDFGAQALEAQ